MKKTALLFPLLLAVLMLISAPACAESPEPFAWQELSLKPVTCNPDYYGYCWVRVSCAEVPMARLYEHRDQIRLLSQDGSEEAAGYVRVMDEFLNGSEAGRTTEFFDLMFKYGKGGKTDSLSLRFGDGDPLPLAGLSLDPAHCVFRTGSGAWVVYLPDRDSIPAVADVCADGMRGKDVTLYLDTPMTVGSVYAGAFLNRIKPATLRLFTPMMIETDIRAETVTELGITARQTDFPVYRNLKKLTLGRLALDFPKKDLAAAFPALEEVDIVISSDDPDVNLMSSSTRRQQVFPALKALTCTVNGEPALPRDPDFLLWLAAQREACPGMTINGADAGETDLESRLSGAYRQKAARIREDQTLWEYRQLITGRNVKRGNFKSAKLLITAFDRDNEIVFASTDPDPGYDLSRVPAGRLAGSVAEADAVAVVYPVLKEASGKYGGVMTAYHCETRIAVIDPKTRKVILDETVVTTKPPESISIGIGATSDDAGKFEVQKGIDAIVKKLK